jgi:hypothetical protein
MVNGFFKPTAHGIADTASFAQLGVYPGTNHWYRVNGTWHGDYGYGDFSNWTRSQIFARSGSKVSGALQNDWDGSYYEALGFSADVDNWPITIGYRYDNNYENEAYDVDWDYFFVRKAVSSTPPAANCYYVEHGNHYYYRCTDALNWANARASCQGVGMDLIRIDDADENTFFKGLVRNVNTWFDANDITPEGEWRWKDNDDLFWLGAAAGAPQNGLYNDWASGEPNNYGGDNDCGHFWQNNNGWADGDCDLAMDYVCEAVAGPSVTVTTELVNVGFGEDDYYLSHIAAGQIADSPAIDAGTGTASALGLDARTTRTDRVGDTGTVDIGYHYPP